MFFYKMVRHFKDSPIMTPDGRIALTGDCGDIDPEYMWEETVDVSSDDDDDD